MSWHDLVSAQTSNVYITRHASPLKKEKKTFCPFCKFLVWYFHNAFSCHWESCWSWKHSKVFCTLL